LPKWGFDMRKLFLILASVLFLGSAFSQEGASTVTVSFLGKKYVFPGNAIAIGVDKNVERGDYGLVIRTDQGAVGLEEWGEESKKGLGCDIGDFYKESFTVSDTHKCNPEEIKKERSLFPTNKHLKGKEGDFYLLKSKVNTIAIFIDDDGQMIQIDGDYLSMEDMENIIKPHLAESATTP
jgi:hypothetical protein